jgi:FkbM family methyltransferase
MAVKKTLLRVLGEKRYLSLLAGAYQRLYRAGLLGKEYQDVYFLKNLIRRGDYCIDIGAHLGYFTLPLSRLAGKEGKVYAVEPMGAFHRILQRLLQKKKAVNVTLYQVALGGDGDFVEMGIPHSGAGKHFAYARVTAGNTHFTFHQTERVRNETGDRLFAGLPRVDYIKCDVEGLEYQVFSSMPETVRIHQPVLLVEIIQREQRIALFELLRPYGYKVYLLEKGKLMPVDVYAEGAIVAQNDYFIPPRHVERLRPFINPPLSAGG